MLTKLVLSFLPLVVLANAEECIDYSVHASEIQNCCPLPFGLPQEPLEDCIKPAEQQVPDKNKKSFTACAYECYTKKLGIINGQTVQMDKIKEYMEKLEVNAGRIRIAAWDACDQNKSKILDALKGHTLKCHPFAFKMMTCVEYLVDRNCPAEYFNDKSEICQKLRSGVPFCNSS
ncbi:uncharacterized protein LOC129744223 [Uranotaenia lowii]|uniref:uncharacterized protein LOC129744223 n=1 Tax=Uranotaenia lowii TaxID=190385 RepID=UPI00247A8D4D|nr:uncharacterized protein LOC129744223 [Uranotaenia lowii]